ERVPHGGRDRRGAELDREPAFALDDAAAQRLAEGARRFGDLLQQEVREGAAIDVACRDRRRGQLGGRDWQRRAVEGEALDAGERSGAAPAEAQDLPTARRRVVRIAGRLAVHAQVARAVLDDAVRLARDDGRILGQPDVQRLAAATQREQQLVRVLGAARRDRRRALEGRDAAPECLEPRLARLETTCDQGRDDLRVGRDLRREAQPAVRDEAQVVVDVAVQRGDHVRLDLAAELEGLERVRVRLADDADARPARVTEHGDLRGLRRERGTQQVVATDRGPQRGDVVAELADLRGPLVDEAEHGA